MRLVGLLAVCALTQAGFAQSPVGVWRAGLQHGKLSPAAAKRASAVKEKLIHASLKLNKDKTFGCQLMGRIMRGKWTLNGKVVTLHVSEVVGMSAKQVAKMTAKDRTAQLKLSGRKLYTLPLSTAKPNVVWKKAG